MRIQDIIPPEAVVDGLRAETKEGVLRELSEAVCRRLPALSPTRLTAVLMDREGLGSTGIGEGVAIPHGKTRLLDHLVAACGVSPGGMEFDSMDGEPAYLFILLVSPESLRGPHVKALANISRLLKEESVRLGLRQSRTPQEFLSLLREAESRYLHAPA